MKDFFSKIGRFFKKNYWIEPLLLVVIVFVVVFSLEGVGNVWGTIKSWFSPNSICKEADRVNVEKAFEQISTEDGERVYIYYYEKSTKDNTMEDANKAMNEYIKSYNKANKDDKIEVYAVNYAVKKYYEVNTETVEKWFDKKMTQERYDQIADEVAEWMAKQGNEVADGTANTTVVPCPTLVCYIGTGDGYEVEWALQGTSVFTFENLRYFFQAKYDKLG